jgi:hypothetical protein
MVAVFAIVIMMLFAVALEAERPVWPGSLSNSRRLSIWSPTERR